MRTGIGNKIKELRRRRGLTQEELAAKIGVTAAAVGNYEHDVSFPKAEVLMRLFAALECSPNELLETGAALHISPRLTEEENAHINKYRALDERGRKRVDECTQNELDRMSQGEEILIAARNGRSNKPIKLKKRSKPPRPKGEQHE